MPEVAPTPVDPSLESVETASVDEALTSSETSEVKPVETEEAVTAQAATQTPPTEVAAETPPTKAAPAGTAEQPPPPETTPTEMAQAVEQQAPEEAPTELQAQAVAPVEVEPVVTTTAETATTVAAVTPPPARPVERPAKPTPRPKPPAAKREHEPAKPTLAALRPRRARPGWSAARRRTSAAARPPVPPGRPGKEYGEARPCEAQSRFRNVGTARLTALIAFRVAADGSVVSSRVSRSSGDQVFDQRAVSTMQSLSLPPRRAAPMPPSCRSNRNSANSSQPRKGPTPMFITMNRFTVKKGCEAEFESVWRQREVHIDIVPGFVEFHLLRGPEREDHHALFLACDLAQQGRFRGLDQVGSLPPRSSRRRQRPSLTTRASRVRGFSR